MEKLNRSFDQMEERINKLEDRSIENIKSEKKKKE